MEEEELAAEARNARFEQFSQAALVTEGAIQRAMQTMEYQLAANSLENEEMPSRDGVDLLRRLERLKNLLDEFSREAAFYAPEDEDVA